MALSVSTPPNAIVYVSGNIATKDFIGIGLFAGIASPPILAAWFGLVSMRTMSFSRFWYQPILSLCRVNTMMLVVLKMALF